MGFNLPAHQSKHFNTTKVIVAAEFCEVTSIYSNIIRPYDRKRLESLVHDAIFCGAISHIISLGSKKKMIWPDARGVIAFMTDIQRLIKRTISKLVRNPMGNVSFIKRHIPYTGFTSQQNSIPMNVFVSGPFPTFIGFLNPLPKSFFNCFSRFHPKSPDYKNYTDRNLPCQR